MSQFPRIFVTALTLLMLAACGPSDVQLAERAEKMRIECLDKICNGDVVPAVDNSKVVVEKKAGRYFSVPRSYSHGDGALVFYWLNKKPMTGADLPENGQNRVHALIEFFLEGKPAPIELSDMVATAVKEGRPAAMVSRSKDLEVRIVQLRPEVKDQSSIFIARDATFPSGKPAMSGCGRRQSDDSCSAYFAWDKNLSITVRFNQRHAEDWPQIYAEITRVLSLVKPL